MKLNNIRREYDRQLEALDIQQQLPSEPYALFSNWFQTAIESNELVDPTAMLLATHQGLAIRQRIVLLKEASELGYVFYTNYNSQKGQDLIANPNCGIHFAWLPLERQIAIYGQAEKIASTASDHYFSSRPRASQIAAWASQQSQPVESRAQLDQQYRETELKFEKTECIPRPPHWGGFIIKPTCYEFWQGAQARLHDRFTYQKQANGQWSIQRLQP